MQFNNFANFIHLFLNLVLIWQISKYIYSFGLSKFTNPAKHIETNPLQSLLGVSIVFFTYQIISLQALSIFNVLNPTLHTSLSLLIFLSFYISKIKPISLPLSSFKLQKIHIAAVPFLLIFLVRFLNSLIQIPLEYDSNAYHLPFVAEWLKSGDLLTSYYTAFAGPIGYYPSNYEVLDLYYSLFTQSDFFVNLLNFPIIILLSVSIYALLRNLKASKNLSFLGSLLVVSQPIFARQLGLPLVDAFFSLTFTTSILFLMLAKEPRDSNTQTNLYAVISGLALGLFIGTKFLGLIYASLVFGLAILLIKKIRPILLLVLSSSITGSFFYIRNILETGNPIFPVHIQVKDWIIFQGYQSLPSNLTDTNLLSNLTSLDNLKLFLNNFYQMTGPITFLSALVIILCGLLFSYKLITSKNKLSFINSNILNIFLYLGVLVYFYLYLKAPYTFRDLTPNIRYAMMFLILLVVFSTTQISQIKSKNIKLALNLLIILTLLINLKLIVSPQDYILYNDKLALNFSSLIKYKFWYMLFFATFIFYPFIKSQKIKLSLFPITIITLSALLTNFQLIANSQASFFYEKWYTEAPKQLHLMQAMDSLAIQDPTPKNVAYSGFNFHYPLYGRQMQNNVSYINVNSCQNCRYHDFKNVEGSIRSNPNFDNWLKNLKDESITHLIVAPNYIESVPSYEFQWAQSNPEKFIEIYSQNDVYIYKLQ